MKKYISYYCLYCFFFSLMVTVKGNDSLFQYVLVPGQAKLKANSSITLQLLRYDAVSRKYGIDGSNALIVDSWKLNGNIEASPRAQQTPYGKLEGFPRLTKVTYTAPVEKPKDNPVRISCEFTEAGKKVILFAYIEIEDFTNAFCIDWEHVGISNSPLKQAQCFYMNRKDLKDTRNSSLSSLEKASRSPNITPEQKLKIEELKAMQKMAGKGGNNTWTQNASTGTAVYNVACNTLYISIAEPVVSDYKAISLVVPGNAKGVYNTETDKCMITCMAGNFPCQVSNLQAQGYVSQYGKVAIPATVHIESTGKIGEPVTGYFTGKIGKVLCGSEIPEIHSVYGYFSVIRQPDVNTPCRK